MSDGLESLVGRLGKPDADVVSEVEHAPGADHRHDAALSHQASLGVAAEHGLHQAGAHSVELAAGVAHRPGSVLSRRYTARWER